ncbi:MAG: hypothetical protein HY580_00720 [Nitrospinae bacterium]|nr:hypothetical protein [Nitrospinota bacterium]
MELSGPFIIERSGKRIANMPQADGPLSMNEYGGMFPGIPACPTRKGIQKGTSKFHAYQIGVAMSSKRQENQSVSGNHAERRIDFSFQTGAARGCPAYPVARCPRHWRSLGKTSQKGLII